MSIKIMNNVWQKSRAKGSARLVLLAIADNANDHGSAFPGISGALAQKTMLTPRAVGNIIDRLAQTCELAVYPRPGTSHHYIVFAGMAYTDAASAIRKLADERRANTRELRRVRRNFASEAAERIATQSGRPPKKLRTTSEAGFGPPPKRASDEPSVTITEPSYPKGLPAPPARPSKKKTKAELDEMFEVIARGSFGVYDNELFRGIGGRAGKLRKYIIDNWPAHDARHLRAFYEWWQRQHPNLDAPNNPDSFGPQYTKFVQTRRGDTPDEHVSSMFIGQEVVGLEEARADGA